MTFVPLHNRPGMAAFHNPGGFAHGTYPRLLGVVLHSTESPNEPGLEDMQGVVNYWAREPLNQRLGAHFIVDGMGNSIQLGSPLDVMWHCGYNDGRCGIEQIGYAANSKADWMMHKPQLQKVARVIAWLHHEYGMPLEVGVEQGVCTHAMVTQKYPAYTGGHTDPGPNYPFAYVFDTAQQIVKAGGWETTP